MTQTTRKTAEQIRAEAAEWDARQAEQKMKHETQYQIYKAAERKAFSTADTHIKERLADINLPIEIKIERRFLGGVEVRVSAYDWGTDETENTALKWHWKVQRGENGGIKKESGCWSGMTVTTDGQVADLKETVKALEILNNIEWATLLDIKLPEYRDYVTDSESIGTRPNFEQQIKEAELAELVGSGKLIKGTNGIGYGTTWYLIVKETPKLYEYSTIGDYYLQEATAEQIKGYYTERMTKEKLLSRIAFPLETKDIA